MKLPTIQSGKYIDKQKVESVIKFTKNGIVYFYAIVNGQPEWLIYTPELEQWFFNSGITITNFSGEPEIICTPRVVADIHEEKSDNKNPPKPK